MGHRGFPGSQIDLRLDRRRLAAHKALLRSLRRQLDRDVLLFRVASRSSQASKGKL